MAQRRHHYERAFEFFLRARRIPYVAVDEARKTLLPVAAPVAGNPGEPSRGALKSFDFVVYGQSATNLLIDIKGRRIAPRVGRPGAFKPGRLESWVTKEDVESMLRWRELFGEGFDAAFIFIYWCAAQPPDALFQEIFEFEGSWYALRSVGLDAYRAEMKPRSPRWGTVYIPSEAYERISQPFAPPAVLAGDFGPTLPVLFPHTPLEESAGYHRP